MRASQRGNCDYSARVGGISVNIRDLIPASAAQSGPTGSGSSSTSNGRDSSASRSSDNNSSDSSSDSTAAAPIATSSTSTNTSSSSSTTTSISTSTSTSSTPTSSTPTSSTPNTSSSISGGGGAAGTAKKRTQRRKKGRGGKGAAEGQQDPHKSGRKGAHNNTFPLWHDDAARNQALDASGCKLVLTATATPCLTLVFKIGSNSLAVEGMQLNISLFCAFVELTAQLRARGHDVVLVTSGAVSVGCQRLELSNRPTSLITKQAVAAVGQCRLMRVYDDFFSHKNQPIGQVLLSRENFHEQHHYTNAHNTFTELLRLGIVPIVNENDTVAVEELRFGDNDTLSARVASLLQADWLFLLTDIDALYTANPNTDPSATPIRTVADIASLRVDTGSTGSQWGTGGMATKIEAAAIAAAAGVRTAIMHARDLSVVHSILAGKRDVGTVFEARGTVLTERKKWIAHGRRIMGTLFVDDGAAKALLNKKSLFAAGVVRVEGDFPEGSCVIISALDGKEVARGMCNLGSGQIRLVQGKSSAEFISTLGDVTTQTVVDRDNLALTSA